LLNNLGNVDYFLGRYDQALRDYTEAQLLLPAYAGEPWYARRRSVTMANQAALYQRLGQYGKALQVYSQLRSTTQPLLSIEKAQVLENTGTLFRRLGDPYKAVNLYDQARFLFETARDTAGQISVAKNTGIALALGLGRRQQALPWFHQALDLATNLEMTAKSRRQRCTWAKHCGSLSKANLLPQCFNKLSLPRAS